MQTSCSGVCLDASFEHPLRLDDGRSLRLRWIRPSDADVIREGFARLSMESRRMRFFAPLHTLSDDAIRYLTEVDGTNHVAIIAVSREDKGRGGRDTGYGVARFIRSASDTPCAELAVTVTDDAQGRGLGRRLVETLAVAAHQRGIETFEMSVLSDNTRARNFLRRLDARCCGRDGAIQEYRVAVAAVIARRATAELPRGCPQFVLH